ncbi:MAG: hypothetical protein LBF38_01750 [Deltaproteobacteria bacterium]|jgi:hypothetical protein|nr:hypothetical protein [Deltaproteobacteria bacterium]
MGLVALALTLALAWALVLAPADRALGAAPEAAPKAAPEGKASDGTSRAARAAMMGAKGERSKPSAALMSCLTDDELLSAGEEALSRGYVERLDKVLVLCYQAGYENPEIPEIWKRLGVLAESKSFFVTDLKERLDLMDEAAGHFSHSARLEFERSNWEFLESDEGEKRVILTDPFLADLIWLGRLRRDEVTMAEIYQRHAAENLDPSHRPEFWKERALFIQAKRDMAKQDTEIGEAREDFKNLWATMPQEVPWRSLADKFGPQKIKKIEVLEAWAAGLIAIANQRENKDESQALFMEALELYKLALKMPLDLFEFTALTNELDQGDLLAPDNDSLLALWGLKDSVYQLIIKKFPHDPSFWAAWGRDYYARSSRQSDYRVWHSYFQIAGQKFQSYVDKSPKPDQALAEWAGLLEQKTYPDLAYLNLLDSEDRLLRINVVLELAKDKYLAAMEIDPDRLSYIKSVSRVLLKLATFKAGTEFVDLLDESNRLAIRAISRDPNTPGSWLERGHDFLTFMELGTPDAEAKNRLTAEAFSAFYQYLLSNSGQVDNLRKVADRVWRASENSPGLRPQGFRLLVEICQRLISIEPREPDYRFALGLSLYSILATTPDWPDDLAFSDSLSAREAFEKALVNFETGLGLLSELERDAPSPVTLGLRSNQTPLPRAWGYANTEDRGFLSIDPGPGAILLSAGFQERFGTKVKMELSRLVTAAKPELLPAWYQYRLAALFRRVAASCYPTDIDQMAFFRLSNQYLTSALKALPVGDGDGFKPSGHLIEYASNELTLAPAEPQTNPEARPGAKPEARPGANPGVSSEPSQNQGPLPDSNGPALGASPSRGGGVNSSPSLRALILAEQGLLFSEMSLLVKKDREFLLESGRICWDLAESDSPGSSRYSRARWAAWSNDPEVLIPFLAHGVNEQTNLFWPSLSEAKLEPAFRDLIDQHWFKTAWFGYSR